MHELIHLHRASISADFQAPWARRMDSNPDDTMECCILQPILAEQSHYISHYEVILTIPLSTLRTS